MSSYRLGTSYPPTDIETVLATTQLTGYREPRSRFYEAGKPNNDLDGGQSTQGMPTAVWTFGILDQTMVNTLRAYTPNFAAQVYLSTRTNAGTFQDYVGVMVWPQKQDDARQFGGVFANLEIVFRSLIKIGPLVDASQAVTVSETVNVATVYAPSVSDSVTAAAAVTIAMTKLPLPMRSLFQEGIRSRRLISRVSTTGILLRERASSTKMKPSRWRSGTGSSRWIVRST